MKRIIYIPIDERPCNYDYVINNFSNLEDIELLVPPRSILGYKKIPANIDKVLEFISNNLNDDTVLIASTDMLNYGGLCPSRLHYFSVEDVIKRTQKIREFRNKSKNLKVYLFSSVMRNPKYSSNDEEPDYYEHFGYEIHRRSFLNDKSNFVELDESEKRELENISIPEHVLFDYENRRQINTEVNLNLLDILNEESINTLVIPQDDSAPYGYTRIEQKKLIDKIETLDNETKSKVYIYPGLDEVGIALVSKAILDIRNINIDVDYIYSTSHGHEIIPNYEDRPMEETLNLHIDLFRNPNNSNVNKYKLFINSAIEKTWESWEWEYNNGTITKNHIDFVSAIKEALNNGEKVIVVDSAYTNGSDKALIKLMDEANLLEKIQSYMGWNTNANSLGSALATGMIDRGEKTRIHNIGYHLIEDYIYQSTVRKIVSSQVLKKFKDTNYFTLKKHSNIISKEEKSIILNETNQLNFFASNKIKTLNIKHPWNRMFEICVELEIE